MRNVGSRLDKALKFSISSVFLAIRRKRGRADSWDWAILLVACVPATIHGFIIDMLASGVLGAGMDAFSKTLSSYWICCMMIVTYGICLVLSELYPYHGSEAIRESGSRKAGCAFLGSILGGLFAFMILGMSGCIS